MGDSFLSRKPFVILITLFSTSLMLLIGLYWNFPKLKNEERAHFKLPRSMDDAKQLGTILSLYKDEHYYTVLCSVFATYIFLQSFAIPGSIFLSILSGYLFSFPVALILVCTCSAIGASICYVLSSLLGRRLIMRYFPEKVKEWSVKVEKHERHMLNYMIFLRITPILPNWFINLASPVIQVPFQPFFWGTFLGVAPPSFLAIQAGTTLHQLTSSSDAVSWKSMLVLCVFALGSLVPILFKKTLEKKIE